jgi:hypothetical protein
MSRKVFTAGEVLAAADVNSFLMDQTVMSFAGSAARGSAIAVPAEGMFTYLEDSNIVSIYDGSNWKTSLAPTGSILQVVTATTSTTTSTTSTVGVNTALSVSITPRSASNTILVYAFAEYITHSNLIALSTLNLRRNSTILGAEATLYFGTNGSGIVAPASNGILDSPNTTSAVTYGTFIKTGNAGNTATVQGRQNIIVMEVAG